MDYPHTSKVGRPQNPLWTRRRPVALRDEDGAFTLMSIFLLAIILACFGFAIDLMRAETARTRLQGTLDQSILAAASKFSSIDPETGERRSSESIVRDYFTAAGYPADLPTIDAGGGCNESFVSASARTEVKTSFLGVDYAGPGFEAFPAPASGKASESMPRVEVSLVLDVSGSMGRNRRIENLRPAAKEFVRMVLDSPCDVSNANVSIVPFATQVVAGETLMRTFDVTEEHQYSWCVDFARSDFRHLWVDDNPELVRTSHFEPFTYAHETDPLNRVCYPGSSRAILPWAVNQDQIDAYIEALPVGGNTSMDIGAKWGVAMLDPSLRNTLSTMADGGHVNNRFRGRPFDYNAQDVVKVLVVMSDGENTTQYTLKDPYRTGPSGIWVDPEETDPVVIASPSLESDFENDRYSTNMGLYYSTHASWSAGDDWDPEATPASTLVQWTRRSGIAAEDAFEVYYHHAIGTGPTDRAAWMPAPDTGTQPGQTPYEMDWTEVFHRMSLGHWSHYLRREAFGGSSLTGYYDALGTIEPSEKDSRLSDICKRARQAGINVFTISFEAPAAGKRALQDCADDNDADGSETERYYDVQGTGIRTAFAKIVQQINLLRLTQ